MEDTLLLAHPFYRSLIQLTVEHCAALQGLPVMPLEGVTVYDVAAFERHQRDATFQYKQARDEVIHRLIALLCRQGHTFVYDAVGSTFSTRSLVPSSTMQAGQLLTSTIATVTEHSLSPRASPRQNMGPRSTTVAPVAHSNMVPESPRSLGVGAGAAAPTVSYSDKAIMRTKCRRLAAVLRLVDFMLRDALFDSIHLGLLKLQCIVEGHTEKVRQRRRMKLITMCAAAEEVLGDLRGEKLRLALLAAEQAVPSEDSVSLSYDGPPVPERAIFRLMVDLAAEVERPDGAGDGQGSDGIVRGGAGGGARQSILTADPASVKGLKRSTMLAVQHAEQVRRQAALAQGPVVPKVRYVVTFDLSKDAVVAAYMAAVNNFMRCAAFQEGLLSLDVCAALLQPITNEIKAQPLENRFAQGNTAAHALLKTGCELLGIDYERALLHARAYSYLCEVYVQHSQLLHTVEDTQLVGMSPETIAGHLETLKASQEQCQAVPDEQDVGAYRLDFSNLKGKVLGMIQRCRVAFFRTIPELYVTHGDQFYNELSRLLDVLESTHKTVEAFVKLVELFRRTVTEEEEWVAKFHYITALKDVLHSQADIVVSEAVVRQNLTIVRVWQRFTSVMSDFESNLDEHCKRYQVHLKQRTKTLLDPLDHARQFLHAKVVHDHNSDADTIIARLSTYLADVDVVLRKGAELEHQQTVLKCHVYNYALMTELATQLQSLHVLWSLVKLVKELQLSFMAANFLDANSVEVDRQLRHVEHTLQSKLQSDSTVSAVQVWLTEAVAQLQQVAPVIRKLQSPTQKPPHICAIHAILDRPIYEQDEVTVGELVDVVGVLKHAAALDAVYEQSLFEHNLHSTVTALGKRRNGHQFVLETDKDNPSLLFVANFEEIGHMLEDQQLTLQGCLNSRYAVPHREEFISVLDEVQQWRRRNDDFHLIQAAYRRVRVLFTCARTSRYLGGCVKFFKIFDENWRNLMNLVKADAQLQAVYGYAEVDMYLNGAKEALATVNSDLRRHIHDQCVKFPRLYMIDADYLMRVYATQDPHAAFHKCISLFPFLTDVAFLTEDAQTASAVVSHGEVVTFRKPTSARSSLMDWFRHIELGMNERLDLEIKEHMTGRHLLEDLKVSRTCQQGRLCAVQALFWSQMLRHLEESQPPSAALRTHMLEVCDQISSFAALTTARTTHMEAYHRRSLENLLILLISQRDLLVHQAEHSDSGGDSAFTLEVSIKKLWDSETNTLVVKQGQHKQVYGYKYCGFGERLVVTPLTDRFYLAVQNVVQSGGLCCIDGDGLGKHQLTAALATELGYDVVPIDCSAASTVTTLTGVVRAHLGTGFWGCYTNISRMPAEFLGTFLTVMSAVHVALANQEPVLFLAKQRVDIVDRAVAKPRFCLFLDSLTVNGECMLPPSVRRQFRIVSYTSPERNVVFSVLLAANNFASVAATTLRLAALCDYIAHYGLCPEHEFLRFVYRAIPLAKLNYVHATATPTTQLVLFTKLLISLLPSPYLDAVTEDDLRYICNLFLEVIYSDNQDGKDFKPRYSLSDSASTLYKLVRKKEGVSSVIVVGAAAVGKSTLIREIASNAVSDHNTDIDQQAQLQAAGLGNKQQQTAATGPPSAPARPPERMTLYSRVLNIYALASVASRQASDEPVRCQLIAAQPHTAEGILESILRTLDPELSHVVHLDTASSLQVATLLPIATRFAKYFGLSVCFVWECTELHQLDPATVMEVPIVTIKAQIYDTEAVIAYQLNSLSTRYCISCRHLRVT
jgi:GTPase SAR1 family protein